MRQHCPRNGRAFDLVCAHEPWGSPAVLWNDAEDARGGAIHDAAGKVGGTLGHSLEGHARIPADGQDEFPEVRRSEIGAHIVEVAACSGADFDVRHVEICFPQYLATKQHGNGESLYTLKAQYRFFAGVLIWKVPSSNGLMSVGVEPSTCPEKVFV